MRWRFVVVFAVVAKHHCSLSHFDFGGGGDDDDDPDHIPEMIMLSVRTTSDGDSGRLLAPPARAHSRTALKIAIGVAQPHEHE